MGSTQEASPISRNLRGMLWMLAAATCFTLMGALMKEASAGLPVAVVVFFRMGFSVLFFTPWVLWTRFQGLKTARLGVHLVRSLVGALSMVCFVYALSRLILADAVALSFTTPLWMVLGAALLLGERAGRRRTAATLFGFAGVLAIVRPHMDFEPASVVALLSAVFTCLAMIIVKKLSTTESPTTIAFYFNFFGTLFAAVPVILFWLAPSGYEALLLLGSGLGGMIGHTCLCRAYALGDATVVAPVDFARLPLATVIGMVFFLETPGIWSLAGLAMVLAALIYISRLEPSHRAGEVS